ncbi:topoisomerase, partial [Klebsiella pneumoniae]|nr:topoisomerase [Klebsiella pneumoniae]
LLAERYPDAKVCVNVHLPELDIPDGAKGVDWNDVLMLKGHEAFPARLEERFFDLIN